MDTTQTIGDWQFESLDTLQQFEALAVEWEALLDAAHTDNIFLSHTWLREWWRAYSEGRQLWVVAARRGGRLAGAAPLMIERTRQGARRLAFMGAGSVVPNHLDFVVEPQSRAELTTLLCDYVWRHNARWDVLDFDTLPEGSPTLAALAQRPGAVAAVAARCPYAVLPRSFAAYLQSRGSETRGQLRAKQHRLMRDYPSANFRRVRAAAELDAAFEALVRLHQQRWTERGLPGSFSNAPFIDFHRAAALAALAQDRLRLYYAQIDGVFAALYLCYRTGRRVQYYNAGYDDRWSKYSLGSQTLAYAIEQSIAEGATEFDFLQGDEAYKTHWATHSRANWQLQLAGPHPRGQLAWARQETPRRLRAWARQSLPSNARAALKRLIRRSPNKEPR